MENATDLVTVYRSMDEAAEDDCRIIQDLLTAEGISATILDDSAPDVPQGVYEVQVPTKDVARAEEVIDANPLPDDVEEVNPGEGLDLEPIFHGEASVTSEMEAMGIKALLESNGIAALMVGDSVLPNLPFEVRVAKENVERAQALVREAQTNGAANAAEAERATERATPEEAI